MLHKPKRSSTTAFSSKLTNSFKIFEVIRDLHNRLVIWVIPTTPRQQSSFPVRSVRKWKTSYYHVQTCSTDIGASSVCKTRMLVANVYVAAYDVPFSSDEVNTNRISRILCFDNAVVTLRMSTRIPIEWRKRTSFAVLQQIVLN